MKHHCLYSSVFVSLVIAGWLTLSEQLNAGVALVIGSQYERGTGTYWLTLNGRSEKNGVHSSGGCYSHPGFLVDVEYDTTYTLSFSQEAGGFCGSAGPRTVTLTPDSCSDVYVDSALNTTATFDSSDASKEWQIEVRPRRFLFNWNVPKEKGLYTLPADGHSQATPSLVDASVILTWSITSGTELGATIDAVTGVLTAGTNAGTVTVKAQNSGGTICYTETLALVKCEGCSGGECVAMGQTSATSEESGIDVHIGMGWAAAGNTAGFMQIKEDAPSPTLASPFKLRYNFSLPGVEKILGGDGALRQIKGPDGLADITVISANVKYKVQMYALTNVTGKSAGIYTLANTPFVSVTVEHPSNDTNKLRVTYTRESDTVYDYTWLTNGWELATGSGLRKELTTTVWSESNSVRTVTRRIQEGSSTPVYQATEKYRTNSYGERLLEETYGTGANALTNTYTWNGNGFLEQVVRSDGSWEYYLYDSANRPTNIFSSFGTQGVTTNKTLCRMVEHTYSTNVISGAGDMGILETNRPRRTIEYLKGQIVGLQYFVATGDVRRVIQCLSPSAAWDNSSNLVTITTLYTNGFYRNEPKNILRPDGTIEIFQYGSSPQGTNTSVTTTNVILAGHPSSALGTNIDDGTKTILIYNQVGQLQSRKTIDVVSGITTAQETYLYDQYKRLTNTAFLDGTTLVKTYGCCTLTSETDREGTVTSYGYDSLKRPITTTRSSITHSNVYDPYGNILRTVRYGTNGNAITNLISTYDDAARLTSATDALGNVTLYTNYVSSGQMVKTTTYPNASTRIETYYRDGILEKITGTAVHGVRYDYDVESEEGTQRAYTKETKLESNGSATSEWRKTYSDLVKRPYKVLFPDSAYSLTAYNTSGQMSKQVDPDGVTTLFQYNTVGEVEYTAIDINTSATIDLAGSDRITKVVNVVTNNGSKDVFRTTTSVWSTTNNSPTVISVVDRSVDGLRTWSINYGLTNESWTVYSGGHRYVTNTLPDGSRSISDLQAGRLLSTTQKDGTGSQIGAPTNAYDAHGRLYTSSDARTGATTFGYDNADRQTTVTTPVPGSGQSAQTTTTAFNSMGWPTSVTLPDGGIVTTGYYLTGEVGTNSGARTYPVAYTWDYAGRMKTMTTWTNFSGGLGAAVTTWNYDANRGFLSNKRYADNNGPTYTYTSAGRLLTRLWARGTNTTYAYSAAGDLSTTIYSDAATPNVTNTYDRLGRVITVNQGSNSTALAYNDAGQLLSESYTAGILNGLSISNVYDRFLRRITNGALSGSTWLTQTTNAYDAASRLSIVSDGTQSATYSYLANSPLVSQIDFKQSGTLRMSTVKSYDNLNRLTFTRTTNSSGGVLSSFAYAHNSANQRTSVTNVDSSRWAFGYDSLGQVNSGKRYWSDGIVVAGQQFEYSFDDIGNRRTTASGGDQWGANLRYQNYTGNNLNQYTQRTVPGSVDVIGSATNTAVMTVNNQSTYRKSEYYRKDLALDNSSAPVYAGITNIGVVNQVTTDAVTNITGNVFLPKATETFAYDADGNLTNDGRWFYLWDAENRLLKMTNNSNVPSGAKKKLEFAYDAQGRRVSKVVYDWNGSDHVGVSTNKFVYEKWNLKAEVDHTNGMIRSYHCGTDSSGTYDGAGGVGGLLILGVATNSTTYFLAYDGNGNVANLVKAADGGVAATYEYGPFGETVRAEGNGANANPVRFSTKYMDSESDLAYYGYRFYNPTIGRWMSRDPIGEHGGRNVFSFVRNAPLDRIDLLGLTQFLSTKISELTEASGLVYSCNCGWIDGAHLFLAKDQMSKIMSEMVKYDKFGGDGSFKVAINSPRLTYARSYLLTYERNTLTTYGMANLATSLFIDWSKGYEKLQDTFILPPPIDSGFSVEDLPSNYLGAMLAVRWFGPNEGLTFEEMKTMCEVLTPEQSKEVYDLWNIKGLPRSNHSTNPKLMDCEPCKKSDPKKAQAIRQLFGRYGNGIAPFGYTQTGPSTYVPKL